MLFSFKYYLLQYACQFLRVENDLNTIKLNQNKLEEEKNLWTEIDTFNEELSSKTNDDMALLNKQKDDKLKPIRKSATENILLNNNTIKTPSNGWRTTRRSSRTPQLAIVRPQPQIVIVQRSASPMPSDKLSSSPMPNNISLPSPTTKLDEKKSKLPLSTGVSIFFLIF